MFFSAVHLFSVLTLIIFWGEANGTVSLGTIKAFDAPNDDGGRLICTWSEAEEELDRGIYKLFVAEFAEGPFYFSKEQDINSGFQSEAPEIFGYGDQTENSYFAIVTDYLLSDSTVTIENDKKYYLLVEFHEGSYVVSSSIVSATAHGNFFNWSKITNLIVGVGFSIIILIYIRIARRRDLYIRRIGGLEALDEALGRATEMGKPVLFIHGLKDMSQIPTIAAVNILGRIASRVANYDAALRVVAPDPVVMSVSQETVQASYVEAGRPDAFNPDHVFVAGTEQFSYAAATEGIMVRERPAAHIMMGYFYAESLLLAETGSTTGAIQIAGTDAFTQLPFFVTTCDYTLLGEELYAASAYLSREPKLLGSLKGQDVGKALLLLSIVLGSVLSTVTHHFFDLPILTRFFTSH